MLLAVLLLAAASPSPSPIPSATPIPDPCGSIISIVTRPTVTTSVCTVRTGHALLENGYTNTVTTGSGGGVTVSYPQSLLRIGSFDPHLEADVIVPSDNQSSVAGTKLSGWNDFGLGAKYELGYSPQWLYGVNAAITYPTGSRAFSAGNAQFSGDFNWSYTASPIVSIAGTMSFNALAGLNSSGAAQSYFAFIPSIVITTETSASSEFNVEYVYYSASGPGIGAKSLIDFSYEADLGPHVQLDAEYGLSPTLLNGQTQHYVGAGASFMI
ncbi:MAG: hypothetical protein JO113_07855 [Candidatus Eremiobacteraeota bacterium]|nr:hypothetical protein [Candidatus Eremiobacteraeota bacterium]